MNTQQEKDVWGEANVRAGIAFSIGVIALLLTYIVFFK